jgi:hypothetical protein
VNLPAEGAEKASKMLSIGPEAEVAKTDQTPKMLYQKIVRTASK